MKTSASALEQYERCPYQYYQERIEKKKGIPHDAMRLGSVCHRTIERLMRKHREDGEFKPFDATLANEYYKQEWAKETGLSGEELFTEGLGLIIGFVERWSPMDPKRILAIEEHFEIFLAFDGNDDADVPGVNVRGVIDLAIADETIDEETGEVLTSIEIVDYKSTHAFLTTRDAEASIQLAIYAIAARKKWDHASRFTSSLHMLQTGTHIQVEHGIEQREGFRDYILATAQQIENEESWLQKLGSDCAWCHLRTECPAYQQALKSKSHIATETPDDLERLVQERQEVALRAKLYKKRQDELDAVLKENLSRTNQPLIMGGEVWRMSKVESLEYDPKLVVDLLRERLGMDPDDVMTQTMEVQKKKLDQLLTAAAKDREGGLSTVSMIQAALQNRSKRVFTTRLNHKKDKETYKPPKRD